jgi:hypothetical protein
MKRHDLIFKTAYATTAAVLALVWLACRIPACGHICLTLCLVAAGVWAARKLAEMDRQFKKQRRRRGP